MTPAQNTHRTFRFKPDGYDGYEVYERGGHIGFVRWYWDGWRAIDFNGVELSCGGYRTRSTACYDLEEIAK